MRMRLETDGAARGNPGPAAGSAVGYTADGEPIFRAGKYLGIATNNVAEYTGVILGLDEAMRRGANVIDLRCDSELMVRQLQGTYRVKSPALAPLYKQARERLAKLDHFTIQHVPRALNKNADATANRCVDRKASFVEDLENHSIDVSSADS